VAEHLRQALTADPRIGEQGVRVEVRDGTVHLSGEVTTPQRRAALAEVVAELAPDLEIRNDVRLVPTGKPAAPEQVW
jgi:hypothetical protein